MKLKDRFAIVTGGAKGIGREIACLLAEEGAHIGIIDLDEENNKKTAQEIQKMGRKVITSTVDISSPRSQTESSSSWGPSPASTTCAGRIATSSGAPSPGMKLTISG